MRDTAGAFYYVRKRLENGDRIRYLSILPSEELINGISHYWSGVSKFISSRQFSVNSAYDYFPRAPTHIKHQSKMHRNFRKSRSDEKSSIIFICPGTVKAYLRLSKHNMQPKPQPSFSKVEALMELESCVNRACRGNTIVCCIFDRFLWTLDIVSLVTLTRYHTFATRQDGELILLSDETVGDLINKAVEAVLGPDSPRLVMNTLRNLYGIDEHTILNDPEAWIDKLKKLLSEPNANMIAAVASKEIRKMITQ